MEVKLLFASPKHLMVTAIRKCWKTQDRSDTDYVNDVIGPNDQARIRDIIRVGHESTLEHSLITYDISGFSRAVLQELSRHRVGVSPSVESSRYTMKKIIMGEDSVDECFVHTGNTYIDALNKEHLIKLKALLSTFDIPNDIAKYSLLESFMTSEQISLNVRSLRHLLQLRGPETKALWEFKDLAVEMYNTLPSDWHIFFEDIEGLKR